MSLNQAQKKAVSHKDGPCLVLAGPGSGKTLTIAKRIEYLIQEYKVRPEEILVITFTKYAAGEMRERFQRVMGHAKAPVTFGTFHGIYYGILKWAYGLNQTNLLTEEDKYRLLRDIVSKAEWEDRPDNMEEKEFLAELAEEIGNVKNHNRDIEAYVSGRYGEVRFREIYHEYEKEKERRRKIDFEDMLIRCCELFRKRPDILKKWQQKFRYILVDEFQDINQVQYEAVRMLAAPEDNLFVVGDDDQSVYGFRGARPGIMQEFVQDYPNAAQILLNVNYRSNAHVVNGALRVISHNRQRFVKEIIPCREAAETIHIHEVKNPLDESMYLLEMVKNYIRKGLPAEQIAVLYRTASDARTAAQTFTEYQIPFRMKENAPNIYEHFICEDICCYFRLALGICQRKDMLRIVNRPNRYIGRDSMAEGDISYEGLRRFYCDKKWMQDRIDRLEQDMEMIREMTPYAAIWYIRKGIGYDAFVKSYADCRSLDAEELGEIFEELQERAKAFRTIEEWFRFVESCREEQKKKAKQKASEAGVEFLTMHGSKGLEYEVVFIIQGNEGATPYKKARTEEELEEERRLFYVAMTRAKDRLNISYVTEKNGKSKSPSRFISELLEDV